MWCSSRYRTPFTCRAGLSGPPPATLKGSPYTIRGALFSAGSAVSALIVVGAAPAAAQSPTRFSLESVVAVDEFAGRNVSHRPQITVDVSLGVRIGDHWQVYLRPWFQLRRPSSSTAAIIPWDKEVWQAGLRYERRGAVATRVDVGYMVSPIGLGLFDARPDLNPTIVPHISYVSPMPVFDPTGPRVVPVAAAYPLGALLTVSTVKWDARVAVVNSSPARDYALGAVGNPRQTPALVAGAGVTPIVGLRLGASMAHGLYATTEEIRPPAPRGRSSTILAGEGEWAFGGSKITAEIVRTALETSADTAIAYEWFVQGMQTLSPRWFVGARREGTSAPPLMTGIVIGARPRLAVFEGTAGFRVTPDVTLRGSYYTRRSYGAPTWLHQAGASVVWSHRWW
jgi:hypothetical protein